MTAYLSVIRTKLGRYHPTQFEYQDVVAPGTWACVDLGAFIRGLPDLKDLEGVVIMEDRDPNFFLSFNHYRPWAETRLNRHGPLKILSTERDLKELIANLHAQKIKVAIGLWNFGGKGRGVLTKAPFFRRHPELNRLAKSSDINPFVNLDRVDNSYAEDIAHQYHKLHETFGFDGLMLGDGFSGFRSFSNPNLYADQEKMIPWWAEFYQTIGQNVHKNGGVFLAYDCMGFSYDEAKKHGIDYREVAKAGLNYLIYQSYPQAWGEYWLSKYAGRFDLQSNVRNIQSVGSALESSKTKILYTVELGDSVEKWSAEPQKTASQIKSLDPLSDGRFLVWANDLFAKLSNS